MKIEIFDDVFDRNYANSIWHFIQNSAFSLGWGDDEIPEHSSYINMHCTFSDVDIDNLGIKPKLLETPIAKHMDGKLVKVVINIASPGQTFFDHTHIGDWSASMINRSPKVLLYYPNLEWRREWGGETMFYTMNNKEIERAVEYKPNRLVVFDGERPHSVRPPTAHSPFLRFTLSMFFTQDKKKK